MSLLYNRRFDSFLPTQHCARSRIPQLSLPFQVDYVEFLDVLFHRLGCAELLVFAVALPVWTILTLAGAVSESNVDFLCLVSIALAGFSSFSAFGAVSDVERQRTVFSRHSAGSSRFLTRQKFIACTLQLGYIVLELSLNTPLSRLASVALKVSSVGRLARVAPIGMMFGMASVWGQLERVGRWLMNSNCGGIVGGLTPRVASGDVVMLTNESLSTYASVECGGDEALQRQVRVQQKHYNHGRADSDTSLSPHESWTSESSGELTGGMPSPIGVVREARQGGVGVSTHDAGIELAYLKAMGAKSQGGGTDGKGGLRQDDTIYLFQYDVAGMQELDNAGQGNADTQMCFFVHKKLSPIKTRVVDARATTTYRPLLRTLIQQSKEKGARDCRHIPAVRSIARGEGEERMEGIRMLPCRT